MHVYQPYVEPLKQRPDAEIVSVGLAYTPKEAYSFRLNGVDVPFAVIFN